MFSQAESDQSYEFHVRKTVSEGIEIFRKGRRSVTVAELSRRPSISARDEKHRGARALVI